MYTFSRRKRHWCGTLALCFCSLGAGCASPDRPGTAPIPPAPKARERVPSAVTETVPKLRVVQTSDPIGDSKPRLPESNVRSGSSDSPQENDRGAKSAVDVPAAGDSNLAAPGEGLIVDFNWALATAAGQNPRVAFAGARIREAFAQWERAQVLWLPDIRVGTSYNRHDGSIQNAQGDVFNTNRSVFYSGLGARAVGAGSPAVPGLSASFAIAEAVYEPRIAAQTTAAREHQAGAATNDVLLDTALAYLDLLEALQLEAIAQETLQETEEVAELTANFARAGQGRQADADRAKTEVSARRNEVLRARESVRVASARLAQQLSIDAGDLLRPSESSVVPIDLVSPQTDLHSLVALGLSNRPEIAGQRHLVEAACERLRLEKAAPLIPSVLLGISYGGFGGGQDSFVGNYDDRFDLDAVAFWNVRNLGFGERAARHEMQARVDQAQADYVRLMDQVAREVVEAETQVDVRRERIEVTREGIASAKDAFRRDLDRIRQNVGLPIEAIQSLRALDSARREYLRSVVEYNEAQFRLHRALGWPIE